MDILKHSLQSASETVISSITSFSFIAYILVNVAFFLIVKYYGLRDIRRGNKNKQC